MSTLTQASKQWSSRPADERYTSLTEMEDFFRKQRSESQAMVRSSRRVQVMPTEDNKGIVCHIAGTDKMYAPTHFSFGQLANAAGAPAGYLRELPAPIAADCINYGLAFKRDATEVGVLVQENGVDTVRAVTGPKYGRIWNSDVVGSLVDHFGDGRTGDFRVPGVFGKQVEITKENTTLYAGDRDMFVFLADEEHRIELPNRRNGETGSLARGFFFWNSEVGSSTFGMASFLFDYVCSNRIVWGAEQFQQVVIRHTSTAPDKWLEELKPAIKAYANSSTTSVVSAIEDARKDRLDNVDEWLATRFGARTVQSLQTLHMQEEGRPIETRWDAVTAVTAKARDMEYQDARVDLERQAGKLLGN